MDKRIIVDSSFKEETRIAFINGSDIEHFEVDTSSSKKQLKGNIYLAKVGRVEPSLQAAFVDFGGNRQGFLPFSEIKDDYYKVPSSDSKNQDNDVEDYYSNIEINKKRSLSKIPKFKRYKIQEVIKKGQIMLIQVSKDERGSKGAALTTFLSIAGKYCVLMPNKPLGIKISKRISRFNERNKLKEIASSCDLSKEMGLIIRTASQDCTESEIKNDFEYVLNIWKSIKETTVNSLAPALINEDSNIVKKFIRDSYIEEYKEIVVEGRETYEKASEYMKQILPNQAKKIKEYKNDKMPIMEFYDLEDKINSIYESKVLLKSGGYLVINPTEALTSIDINSGRSTKERNIEETALKTNIEAVDEITRQIRIRNIAGLIVIDFIDMEIYKNKIIIEKRLKDALRYDRAKCQMGRISRFGLLEVSRQRIGPSIIETMMEETLISGIRCTIRSITSSIVKILKKLKYINISKKIKELHIFLHKQSHEFLEQNNLSYINSIEKKNKIKIKLITDNNIAPPFFIIKEVESNKKNKVIYDDLPRSLKEDEKNGKKLFNKKDATLKNKIKKESKSKKKINQKPKKKIINKKKNVNPPELQPII